MRSGYTLVFCLLLSLAASAEVLHVPKDYSTIQEAINAAQPYDTVKVCPGVYVENIDFLGKPITLLSAGGPEYTLIDGSQPVDINFGSVVRFMNNEGRDSVLDGFTLTGGTGTYVKLYPSFNFCGGGILCYKASPSILNCRVIDNTARVGGGLLGDTCSGIVKDAVFADNHSTDNGGGIYCVYCPSARD